jgi:hypothetical protein
MGPDRGNRTCANDAARVCHSHSIVPGGLLVTS